MIDQLDAIETARLRLRAEGRAAFVVQHEGEAIGRVGFRRGAWLAPKAHVWITPAHRGRGFATEALKAALAWARDGWGRRWLAAGHRAGDAALARVLVKCGFLYTDSALAPVRRMVWLA